MSLESIYIDKLKIWTDMGALNICYNYSKMAIHLSVNTKLSVTALALDNKVFCNCLFDLKWRYLHYFKMKTLLWCSLYTQHMSQLIRIWPLTNRSVVKTGQTTHSHSFASVQIRLHNQRLISLFLNQNVMLWVLKRTVSMRRFFWAPKTYVKTDG